MKFKSILVVVLVFLFCSYSVLTIAQSRKQWKKELHNLQFTAGVANLYSDLGGGKGIHEQTLKGLNFLSSRADIGVGYNYRICRLLNFKTGFTFAWMSCDDQYTKEENRNKRGLVVETPLLELEAHLEFYVTVQEENRYSKGRLRKGFPFTSYVFGGLCGYAYFPMAKNANGKLTALRKLGTEGQNYYQTRKPYSVVDWGVPFGIGFKYNINRKIGIGVEWGIRWCFTDYLDDASTSYVSKEVLEQTSSDAAYFGTYGDGYRVGEQRGNPLNSDAYMFINASVYMKLGKTSGYKRTSLPDRYRRF